MFGGVVVAQALSAAIQSVEGDVAPHSLHGYFLRPERPDAVELNVECIRDGRTFTTRRVILRQDGKDLFHATCSFYGGDSGAEYQLPMPDVPRPDDPPARNTPPAFDVRENYRTD